MLAESNSNTSTSSVYRPGGRFNDDHDDRDLTAVLVAVIWLRQIGDAGGNANLHTLTARVLREAQHG